MKHDKELNIFIAKFYAYKLFSLMGFIFPLVAVMFDANGLNATQIAIVMMTAKVVQLVTEIPSGVIADKYSRKYVIIASQVCTALLYTCWIFFPNFWGYLVGYAFCGLGMSLSSGCIEAFVYDELSKHKSRKLFERVQGRSGALSSVGILIASIMTAFLVKSGYDYNFLMFMTIVTTIISIFIMLTIKPAKKVENTDEPESVLSYMETLKTGVKYTFSHKLVLKFILFLAFDSFINIGAFEYSEIFYNEITGSLAKVAILFGLMEIMYIIGNFFAEYLKKIKTKTLMLIYFAVTTLSIVAYSIYSYPISMVLVMLSTLLICPIFVNFTGRANDLVPSKIRATVLSVKGFIESVGAFVTLFSFGLIVDYFGAYRMGFLTFSYIFVAGSFVFLVLFLRDKNIE